MLHQQADAPVSKPHTFGILLVHGIAEQPEEETLLGFGEPVIDWLNRWLTRDKLEAERAR
jgi:hypothetical protein